MVFISDESDLIHGRDQTLGDFGKSLEVASA